MRVTETKIEEAYDLRTRAVCRKRHRHRSKYCVSSTRCRSQSIAGRAMTCSVSRAQTPA